MCHVVSVDGFSPSFSRNSEGSESDRLLSAKKQVEKVGVALSDGPKH